MRLKKQGDVDERKKNVERERMCLERDRIMHNEEIEKKRYSEYMKQMEVKKGYKTNGKK